MNSACIDHALLRSKFDIAEMISRNLEPGIRFHTLTEGSCEWVVAKREENQGEQRWIHPAQLLGLIQEGVDDFSIVEMRDDAILIQLPESSYISYGYAAPMHRMARRKRKPIMESEEGMKELIRAERPLIKHMIRLKDAYDKDGSLNSSEAKAAMKSLLHAAYYKQPGVAAAYGAVEFEPNELAWMALLDQADGQSLGKFLGIDDPSQIPGEDMDARVDAVVRDGQAAEAPEERGTEQILASAPRVVKPAAKRLQEIRNIRLGPVGAYFKKPSNSFC